MRSFSIEVGRLLCGRVRSYLAKAKFEGAKIEWIESSGILEREFTIKGESEDVKAIERDFDVWFQVMNSPI
jgi:hypothetical protein